MFIASALQFKDPRHLQFFCLIFYSNLVTLTKEKNLRIKSEKQRSEQSRRIDELDREIEKFNNSQAVLNDTRIKCENEIIRLKQELEITNRKHEIALSQLRYEHEDTVSKMNGRINQLTKTVSRLEKEKL